jgi:hypothetical protein
MRSTVLLEILSGVDGLNAVDVDAAKRKFKQLIRAIGAEHGIKAFERSDRVDFARNLLDSRVSRTTIMERLKARYGVSREQAYRDIRAALHLCHRSPPIGTTTDENTLSDDPLLPVAANERT